MDDRREDKMLRHDGRPRLIPPASEQSSSGRTAACSPGEPRYPHAPKAAPRPTIEAKSR